MIDFTNLKYLHIPEGEVVKISKGSEVLWEKITKKYQTELAYIESTGTQWIDTKYVPSTNTKVEIKIGGVSDSSFVKNAGGWFIGSRTGSNNRGFGTYYNPLGQALYGAFGNQQTSFSVTKTSFYNKEHTIVVDKTGLYLDGVKGISFNNSFDGQYPLYLFTINLAGSLANLCSFKLYGLKIWQDGALVRDYIPVLDMNNAACLYDKETEQLFYNSGTGEFNYATIEDEYREVEYIESTGTEWIDTEYNINTATDSVYLEFEALEDTLYKWLFGEHDNNARFGIGTGDGAGKRNVAYGANTYKVADSKIFDGKHIFIADSSGVYLDGTKVANYTSFKSTSTLYLFNLNLSGGTYQTKARVWKYQHYRNGELIRDMYPVLSKSLNRAGLFDKATNRFFGNNGTGEFQYAILPVEYKQVAFIESTGAQYINPNIQLTSNHSVEIDYQLTNATQYRTGLFGGLGSNASARYGSILSPTNAYLEHGYGSGNVYWQQGKPDTNRHVLRQIKNKVYFDDDLIYTFAETTFSVGSAAYMCNFNYTNYKPAQARYYESKWWDGDVLIRHFIPCYRKEDGVAGLYDTVTKAFFTNKGTGAFVYPTDIEVAQLMMSNSLDEDMIEALAGVPTKISNEYDDYVVE